MSDDNKEKLTKTKNETISHEKVANKLGLVKSSISIMINSMTIDILRNMYRFYKEPVLKPVMPELARPPVEPTFVREPVQPDVPNFLEYLSDAERKVEIEKYKKERERYEQESSSYSLKLKKYNEEKAEHEVNLKKFETKIAKYKIDLKVYDEELAKYEEYTARIKLNEKIVSVYEKWTNMKWKYDGRKVSYSMLIGPPGHGKTTAFKQSAKIVSDALGLKYIEKPVLGENVDINCFVLTVVNLAGEVSKSGLAGLPAAESDAKGNRYTSMLPSYGMRALQKAGGGILLLDDLTNASEFIQNIALPLTDENTFNELKLPNVYVGVTANMGALDGTNTSSMSSALRNRVKPVFVEDTIEDFISRARKANNDELGDGYVCDFLLQDPSRFISPLPKKDEMGGYTTPRSLDNFISVVRRHIYDNGGKGVGEVKAIEIIKNDACSMLGVSLGIEYEKYLTSIKNHADPVAKKMILEKKFDRALFEKGNSSGHDAKSKDFSSLIKAPIVGYSIMALSQGYKKAEVYACALYLMLAFNRVQDFNTLLKYFSENIAAAFEELGTKVKKDSTKKEKDMSRIIKSRTKTGNALNEDECKIIMEALNFLLKDDLESLKVYKRSAASILAMNDIQTGMKARERIE